jgi:hypothetical protein
MQIVFGQRSCPFEPWRPADGRSFDRFAYDTETTEIDADRPYLTPVYVLGAACDGERGVFITRESLLPFFHAHRNTSIIMHHAAFDLKVTARLLEPHIDIYEGVDANLVWDTLILKRLYSLATAGHTARGGASLADCAREHLGVELQKSQTDAGGHTVRTGFGQFLGRPPSEIPTEYLTYLAQDVLATWGLFWELNRLIKDLLQNSHTVWGFVNHHWLRDVIHRFGPLTHHLQLRASILMDVLNANGIGIDRTRRQVKAEQVQAVRAECRERMRQRGYLVDERGSAKAMQSILSQFHRAHPDVDLKRTESGERWSTAEEDLAELAQQDPFFRDYLKYRHAEKLLSTYLDKMGPARIHPRFGYLLETGRTSCSGFTLQNLPNERDLLDDDPDAATIRGCFVPGDDNVFIDSDYGQIELVVLGYALEKQFGQCSQLAQLINGDCDVHRLIAAAVLGKEAQDVTKAERQSAKPVSFGRPGGMGVGGLRRVAKSNYGMDLTEAEVQQRINAYHTLCPELNHFLQDEVNPGAVVARALHLTPAPYYQTTGKYYDPSLAENNTPADWLGGMLLKVLREAIPVTQHGTGRSYTPEEIAFLWEQAQRLPVRLKPQEQAKLQGRQSDKKLWKAVRDWAGRRSVFTVTGRLRANATFCSSRNTIFQGAAADGNLLGLWLVWRAGYQLVDFVHDQLVVESPADDKVQDRVAEIERLMKQGMGLVVPGMLVKVETVVTRSLNKKEVDTRYDPKTHELVCGDQRIAG